HLLLSGHAPAGRRRGAPHGRRAGHELSQAHVVDAAAGRHGEHRAPGEPPAVPDLRPPAGAGQGHRRARGAPDLARAPWRVLAGARDGARLTLNYSRRETSTFSRMPSASGTSTATEKYALTRYDITAFSLMPMKRTFRLGWYSSGMPVWCRPTTPSSSSPVRIAMIEDVWPSVIGILLHGKIGTPRQAGTWLPWTSIGGG